MENLPVEVREVIYERLDNDSLLQIRLVNSAFKGEVDHYPGFNVSIDTDGMSEETFKKLFDLKINSLRLCDEFSYHDESYKSPTGWDVTPKYPTNIKTLKLGGKRSKPLSRPWGRACFEDQLFFKILKECPNIEKLFINATQFYGEILDENVDEDKEEVETKPMGLNYSEEVCIVKSMRSLKSLTVKDLCVWLPEDLEHNPRTLHVLYSLLANITSPVLTSMDLEICAGSVGESGGPEPPETFALFPNPWSTIFKLISRHWETLKDLHLQFYWDVNGHVEDWTWVGSDQEFEHNLKRLDALNSFSLLHNILPECENDQVIIDKFLTLMRQQKSLQNLKLDTSILTSEALKEVTKSNANSLRVVKIYSLPDSIEGDNDVLDMDIFSNCSQLEKLTVQGSCREVVNLGHVPAQVQHLTLGCVFGFSFPMSQLRALSVQCQNLRTLKLNLKELTNVGGLASVMTSFIRYSEQIQSISFEIKRKLNNLNAAEEEAGVAWDQEIPTLENLFKCFSSHQMSHYVSKSCATFRQGHNLSLVRCRIMSYTFRAWDITLEDRAKIFSENQ